MKVNIDELKLAPQQRMYFSYKENIEGLDAVKPVIGELLLIAGSSGVRLQGKLQTLLRLNCHRCLQAYFQSINLDLDERFVYQLNNEPQKDRELLKDDFVDAIPDDGVLDINDIVYQAVTLATPTFCLCGDDCPGPPLPSSAAGDISLGPAKEKDRVDPRWKNLKTLFPNEETN